MPAAVRVFAGTRSGLYRFAERAGRLVEEGAAFGDEIVQAVAGSPGRPERVYVALRTGLFRSEDCGASFAQVLSGDVRSVTVDPTDDAVVYAGTDPVHLLRSEDGGRTFAELASLQELPEATHRLLGELTPMDMAQNTDPSFRHRRQDWWIHPPYHGHILHIFVHPDDPALVVCSIEHGGIALSADRGATWQDASGGIDYLDIHYLTALPHRPDRYLVSSARGLFASSDPRAGWTRAERGCAHDYFHDLVLVRGAAAPAILVAAASGSPGNWRREGRGARAAVYRSHDDGGSWERVGAGHGLEPEMDAMVWALEAHPAEPSVVIAAVGLSSSVPNPARGAGSGSIVCSRDAGDSWQPLVENLPAVEHLHLAAA